MSAHSFIEKRLGINLIAMYIALSLIISSGTVWFFYDYTGLLKHENPQAEQARFNQSIAAAQAKADKRAAEVAALRKQSAR